MSKESKKPTSSSSLAEFAEKRGRRKFESGAPSNGMLWNLPNDILREIWDNADKIHATTIADYIRENAPEGDTSPHWRPSVDAVKQWIYRWHNDPVAHDFIYGDDA